jgi:dynein heavy chain, axonemal
VKRNAADEKELLNIEDNILMSLSQGNGGVAELLLDESLINQLQNSKKFAEEINQRIQDSRIT